MRKTAIILAFLVVVLALAACDDDPPPTQIVLVVTATTEPDTTVKSTEPSDAQDETPDPAPTAEPSEAPPTEADEPTKAPTDAPPATQPADVIPPTALPEAFPTNVVAEVQLAEQVFEHGRMFWIRHSRQIWVMQESEDDPYTGDWFCYNDTFEEGEMEIDASLTPPEGLNQPRRGFGKLWRNNPQVKDGLGWAVTPEFELTSNYVYLHGGYVDADTGEYFQGPGENRLNTLYNENISFFEEDIRGDCLGGSWRLSPTQ